MYSCGYTESRAPGGLSLGTFPNSMFGASMSGFQSHPQSPSVYMRMPVRCWPTHPHSLQAPFADCEGLRDAFLLTIRFLPASQIRTECVQEMPPVL